MEFSLGIARTLRQDGRSSRCDRCLHPCGGCAAVNAALGLTLVASLCASGVFAQEPIVVSVPGQLDPFAETRPGRFGDLPAATPGTNLDTGLSYSRQPLDAPRQMLPVSPESFSSWNSRNSPSGTECWTWQKLPDGVIYSSYLAGPKEPRFAAVFNHDSHFGSTMDLEAGGRVGLLRYGTKDGSPRPDGWELDLEGAAFPRLDLDHDEDLISADFRVGVPLTFGYGPFQAKIAVYHLSSHLGDEFMLRFPEYPRINYSRNAVVLGGSYYLTDDLRVYAEADWAWYTDGGTKPWEFQFGLDYSPIESWRGCSGAPFLAVNGQIREEVDYGGDFVVQAGWQWRGESNHLFRVGVQYFTGKSDQYQFFRRNEEKVGVAMWYDF